MQLSFAFTTLLASASASTLSALSEPIGAECGVFKPCDEGMACESGGTCVKNAEKETMLGKHSSTYTPTNLPQGLILVADPDARANRQLWSPFGIMDREAALSEPNDGSRNRKLANTNPAEATSQEGRVFSREPTGRMISGFGEHPSPIVYGNALRGIAAAPAHPQLVLEKHIKRSLVWECWLFN
jgi:hypothetical protein